MAQRGNGLSRRRPKVWRRQLGCGGSWCDWLIAPYIRPRAAPLLRILFSDPSLVSLCLFFFFLFLLFKNKRATDAEAALTAVREQLAQSQSDAEAARAVLKRELEAALAAAREETERAKSVGSAAIDELQIQLVRLQLYQRGWD